MKSNRQQKKNFFFVAMFLDYFQTNGKILDHFFPLLFPKDSESQKNSGHTTLGSGGKKTVKRYLKSERTDRPTNTQTDISTYRKHRPRGPML